MYVLCAFVILNKDYLLTYLLTEFVDWCRHSHQSVTCYTALHKLVLIGCLIYFD